VASQRNCSARVLPIDSILHGSTRKARLLHHRLLKNANTRCWRQRLDGRPPSTPSTLDVQVRALSTSTSLPQALSAQPRRLIAQQYMNLGKKSKIFNHSLLVVQLICSARAVAAARQRSMCKQHATQSTSHQPSTGLRQTVGAVQPQAA
jgi:hypothetical protein